MWSFVRNVILRSHPVHIIVRFATNAFSKWITIVVSFIHNNILQTTIIKVEQVNGKINFN